MTTRRSSHSTAGLAAVLFAASLCAPRDAFGARRVRADTQSGSNDVFEVTASAPWPDSLRRGWQPVFVELTNVDDETHDFTIAIFVDLYSDRTATVNDRVRIEPGARVTREIPVPVPLNQKISVSVRAGDGSWWERLEAGTGAPDRNVAAVVFRNTLATAAFDIQSLLPSNSSETRVDVKQMPRRLASLTSLDLVLLDVSGELPDAEQQSALLAWVRLGGSLVVHGLTTEAFASRMPQFAPHLDEWRRNDSDPSAPFQCGVGRILVLDAARFGGSDETLRTRFYDAIAMLSAPLRRQPYPLDQSGTHDSEIAEARGRVETSTLTNFVPRFAPQKHDRPQLAGSDGPSHGILALLLVAFTILIGPFSFFVAKRRGTPLFAFGLVPLFGLAGSGVVFLGTMVSRGFDVRVAGDTWAVLDQRSHRVAVVEQRVLEAPFAGSIRLDPAFGACIPDFDGEFFKEQVFNPYPAFFMRQHGNASLPRYFVDMADGFELSGGFLPARRVVRQIVLQEETTRARLDVRFENTGQSGSPTLVVTNALPVPVEVLFVRTSAAEIHYLRSDDSPLAPGGTARLTAGAITSSTVRSSRFLPIFSHAANNNPSSVESSALSAQINRVDAYAIDAVKSGHPRLALGDYVAITRGRAFPLDGGLDVEAGKGDHVVFGTLEDAAIGEKR